VVRTPRVLMTSFTAIGTPASSGSGLPAATSASILCACAYARSSQRVRYTFISLFRASMRLKCSAASSRADPFFAPHPSFTPRIVQYVVICSPYWSLVPFQLLPICHPEGRAVCDLNDPNPVPCLAVSVPSVFFPCELCGRTPPQSPDLPRETL